MLDQLEMELRAIRREIEGINRRLKKQALEVQAYSLQQAAELLGCSPRHIARLLARGELLSVRVGGLRRIPRTELEKAMAPKEPPPPSPAAKKGRFVQRGGELVRLRELRRKR